MLANGWVITIIGLLVPLSNGGSAGAIWGIRVGNRWLVLWYFFNGRDGKYGTCRVRRAHRTLWMNYG